MGVFTRSPPFATIRSSHAGDFVGRMVRILNRLKALTLQKLPLGMHADGGGLYLQVTATGGRSWIFRYMLNGRAREMGLGPLQLVTLAEARLLAQACRQQRYAGIDPIDARKASREKAERDVSNIMTFKQCAESYIASHSAGWRNEKHGDQWRNTFKTYAWDHIGSLPVQEVGVDHVIKILEPIWSGKTETASRLRGRIESVLDWATARGFRRGENPARWRGHLDQLLPPPSKVRQVKHFSALPFNEVASFMRELTKHPGTSSDALQFSILTAARTSEVCGARWEEIHAKDKVWIIPKERMKAGVEHRVPLSDQALAILKRRYNGNEKPDTGFVFSIKGEGPLSTMAMLKLLARMNKKDITVHGFRSTFRDWAAESTNFSREVCEMALAHTVGDKVEAAYRRGDLLSKRVELMKAWGHFCADRQAQRKRRQDKDAA